MARSLGRRRGLAAVVLFVVAGALVAAPSSGARGSDGLMSFLENGKVRVGVNLFDGGKITYLAAVEGPDRSDLLQDSQQSYYGGPLDAWWHVAASGGTVLANRNDGRTIYTKVIPQQDYPYRQCDCTFETWVTLNGSTVHVRNRLTNFRIDGANFTPHGQELPAVYTTGDAYCLYTYEGNAPYTGAPIHEVTEDRSGFFSPGPSFLATEHWAALVNDEGFGVGLYEPRLTRFSGIPGNEYAVDYGWINGYVTASTNEILGPNAVYTYDYTLVVGTLDDIRGYALRHRLDPRPAYVFRTGRQHWWEWNASDAGDPIRGALRIYPDRDDPQLYGPETWFPASGVRALYIRGAWHTHQNGAQLFWKSDAGDFSEDRSTRFWVDNDGAFRTYRVWLAGRSGWAGTITGLRLDPVDGAEPGGWIDISCISWKPCPRTADERRLTRTTPTVVFQDTFDSSYNPSFWFGGNDSPGTSTTVQQGRLVLTVAPDAHEAPGVGYMASGIASRCKLAGNYDVRVGYRLLEWPPTNGVNVNFGTSYTRTIGRLNSPNDAYFAYFPPGGTQVGTTSPAGELRLVRQGGTILGYYANQGRWTLLDQSDMTRVSVLVQLSIYSTDTAFDHQEVQVAFDDFRVVRGRLICP